MNARTSGSAVDSSTATAGSQAGNFVVEHGPRPADHFAIVSNDMLRGRFPVPLKALERVLLLHLLSLPPNWKLNRASLDDAVMEGRDAVKHALASLEHKGYILRTRRRGRGGTWMWTWQVTDDPVARPIAGASPSTENQSMEPTSENTTSPQVAPSTENPSTENQAIVEDGTTEDWVEDCSDLRSAVPAAASPGGDGEREHLEQHARRERERLWRHYRDDPDYANLYDDIDTRIEALVPGLSVPDVAMVAAMAERGEHPKAILNAVLATA